MIEDIRLIAVTNPLSPTDRLLVECVAAAAGGATAVQLRCKSKPARTVLGLVELLVDRLTVPVYVNDRADIAQAAGAAGVHIGAEDLPAACIRAVCPRPCRVGVSVGSPAEAAAAMGADADYWSIGPFERTTTKDDAGRPLGVEGFVPLARLAPPDMPLVAIGGIHAGNVGDALRAGAHGVAVTSAIFDTSDPTAAARRLRDALDASM